MKKYLTRICILAVFFIISSKVAGAMFTRLKNYNWNNGDHISTWEYDINEDGIWDGDFILWRGTTIGWNPYVPAWWKEAAKQETELIAQNDIDFKVFHSSDQLTL